MDSPIPPARFGPRRRAARPSACPRHGARAETPTPRARSGAVRSSAAAVRREAGRTCAPTPARLTVRAAHARLSHDPLARSARGRARTRRANRTAAHPRRAAPARSRSGRRPAPGRCRPAAVSGERPPSRTRPASPGTRDRTPSRRARETHSMSSAGQGVRGRVRSRGRRYRSAAQSAVERWRGPRRRRGGHLDPRGRQ